MRGAIRAGIRGILLVVWALILLPPTYVAWRLHNRSLHERLIQLYYRVAVHIAGIRIETSGYFSDTRPLLVVSNHSTYLDILVLGAVMPVRFTPKLEIASWPLIGHIARITGSLFLERHPRRSADQKALLHEALKDGSCISVFPEGSTSDGAKVLPFKSSLFSLAEETYHGQPLTVQPVTLAYTRLNNLPMGLRWRSQVAWYGDMDFVPHFWNLLKLGIVTVHVTFHPPISLKQCASRKEMASYCQDLIGNQLQTSLREKG